MTEFPHEPRHTQVGGLRIAHIDEGPGDAQSVLLMHGEPTWSFLYRKMIPVLLAAGHRGAGHFLQEDKGEELAEAVNAFIQATAAA